MELLEQVRTSLAQVIDPELDVNIVDLGLIYDIEVNENNDVQIIMTLTTPGCPLHDSITGGAKAMVQKIAEVNQVDIKMVWEPAWSPDMMSDKAREMLAF